MASIRLNPPEPFDFKQPDQWEKWRRSFEQFRVASGLSSEKEDRKVSTLLYCLGEAAEDVLLSSNTTDKDRKEYKLVLGKFDEFFKVRKYVIFNRARFSRRNQLEGESSEQYVTVLHSLAENCNNGNLKHEMIRNRIVVGIRDSALSERLQLDPISRSAGILKTRCQQRILANPIVRGLKTSHNICYTVWTLLL